MAKTMECIHSMDKLWNVYIPWLNCARGMYTFNGFSCWKYTFHSASHGIWIRYSNVTQTEARMYCRAHNSSTSPILSISSSLVALYCSTDFFQSSILAFFCCLYFSADMDVLFWVLSSSNESQFSRNCCSMCPWWRMYLFVMRWNCMNFPL